MSSNHVTTGPIAGSAKHYEQIDADGTTLRIPVRRINLTNGEHFDVYDTSGPYTDDSATIDLEAGLPKLRAGWTQPDVPGPRTQLAWARAGVIISSCSRMAKSRRCTPRSS